jgi:transposase
VEKNKQRRLSGDQKMAIIAMHLKQKRPVSDVCSENSIQPSVYYKWQEELFANGRKVFEEKADKTVEKLNARIAELELKLKHKNEVLFELMEEHVKVKKNLGLT